jgi:hypothetical protein
MLVASLSGCATAPAGAPAPGVEETNYEGLATVRSRAFDIALVRPGTDFQAYSRLKLGTPELAYRPPDRKELEFALSEEQKTLFLTSLVTAFDKEFGGFAALELAEEPGPGTLTLAIRVEDIVVTVAPSAVGRSGRGAALLETAGNAVITVELRDSVSNAILARGVDTGAASGGALRTPEGELKVRFDSSEKIVERWAAKTRAGIENLLKERR